MKTNWRKYKKKRNMEIKDKKKLMADAAGFIEEVWSIHDNHVQHALRSLHNFMYSSDFSNKITSKIAVYAVLSRGTIGTATKEADDFRMPNFMTDVATWTTPDIKYPEDAYREAADLFKRRIPIVTSYRRELATGVSSTMRGKVAYVGVVV